VGLGGVETDMQAFRQALYLEHDAAAALRRHDNGRQHFGGDTRLPQRVLHGGALGGGIVGRRQVLQQTAAARAEMTAGLVQANFPAAK
jgi:hypothetical protein